MSNAASPTTTTAVFSPVAYTVSNPQGNFVVPPATTANTVFQKFGQGPTGYYAPGGKIGSSVPPNALQASSPAQTPYGGAGVGATPNGGAVPGALYPSINNRGAWSQMTPAQQAQANASSGGGFFASLGSALGNAGGMVLIGLALLAVIEVSKK